MRAIETDPPGRAAAVAVARFPTFEGLRALAALGVLVFHAAGLTEVTTGPDAGAGAGAWLNHLSVGVSVFFVLSGFLLFRPMVEAHLRGVPGPPVVPYLVRRAVRIYPAYWVALAASVWLLDLNIGDGWAQFRFFALLQIYWGDTVLGGLPQAWTLCTEVSFYLFLPVWAAAMARVGGSVERRARLHLVGLGVLYAIGLVVRARLRSGGHDLGYTTLPANIDLFAIGMALAVASASSAVRRRAPGAIGRTLGGAPGAAWLAAACCYGAVVALRLPYGFDPPTVVQEVLRQVLFGLIAGLVVGPGVFGPQDDGWIRQALRWRPVVALGVVSYGLYLWHLTVQEWLVRPGRPLAGASLAELVLWSTPVAVALAAASWFGIERPLLRAVRQPARRPGRQGTAPGGATGRSERIV